MSESRGSTHKRKHHRHEKTEERDSPSSNEEVDDRRQKANDDRDNSRDSSSRSHRHGMTADYGHRRREYGDEGRRHEREYKKYREEFSGEKKKQERGPERGTKQNDSCQKAEQNIDANANKPCWDNSRVKRHAEMIQGRKLLWKGKATKNEGKEEDVMAEGTSQSRRGGEEAISSGSEKKLESKWTSMIAATAKDTQQMDKFQRLMGLKKSAKEETKIENQQEDTVTDPMAVNKEELEREKSRQINMERDLDKQFEIARHAHHSARGRGLGSF